MAAGCKGPKVVIQLRQLGLRSTLGCPGAFSPGPGGCKGPAFAMHDVLTQYCVAALQAMQVQNYVWGPAIMTFITAVANVPINMILIRYYDFWGAALATSVARILLLVLLVGECCISRHTYGLTWTESACHVSIVASKVTLLYAQSECN